VRPRDALVLAALCAPGCKRAKPAPKPASAPVVHAPDAIPHTTVPIKIDGEWNEDDWPKVALRGQFRGDDGELARPSSEVRFLHDDADLIVALYAADGNIQTSDAFDLTVGPLALHVDATGKVTPPTPGVRDAADYDEGTLDHPQDDDEEWVVELAIPLAKTGLRPGAHVPVRAARCDTPKDGIRRCGSWSATLTLE
jgi:hypothetical protein